MKPDAIAAVQKVMDDQLKARAKNPMQDGLADVTLAQCFWLAEIALQIARLNANLDIVTGCIEGDSAFRIADAGGGR